MKKIIYQFFGGLFVAALLFGGFFISDAQAEGIVIGASPGGLEIDNAVRDISVYRDIVISRSGEKGEATLRVGFSGDAAEYMRGPETLVIPEGASIVQYELEIRPENAPNGEYTGFVDFSVVEVIGEDRDETAAVLIRPGVAVRINMTVQDLEVLDVEIGTLSASQTEVRRPLFVSYPLNNVGNVTWKPDRVDFRIYKADGKKPIKTISLDEKDLPEIKPGLNFKFRHPLIHELDQGMYKVLAVFYYEDKVFHKTASVPFTVFPEGQFQRLGEFVELETNKTEYLREENVQITGKFKNIGELPTDAKMTVEIFSEEGELLESLTSDEAVVDPSQTASLSVVTSFEDYGTYKARATVSFEGRQTEPLETAIFVPRPEGLIKLILWIAGVVVMVGVTVFAIIYLVKMGKKTRKTKGEDVYIDLPLPKKQ